MITNLHNQHSKLNILFKGHYLGDPYLNRLRQLESGEETLIL